MRRILARVTTVATLCSAAVGLGVRGLGEITGLAHASRPRLHGEQAPVPSTDRLVAATIDYIRDYQDTFKFLVADEVSVQRVVVPPGPAGEPSESRTTRGEMFVTYLDIERQWTAVHDIAEVNGVAVADREDLPALLRLGTFASVARRVFDWNARYNIGRVIRNFNDPMLALLPFTRERRPRFSFSREALDRTQPGLTLATVRFRERERPTIVRNVAGRSIFATGEVVIDASTGVVRKTTITIRDDDVEAELTTDFTWEEKLRLWVPALFLERYTGRRDGRVDVTICESRYTNYRRFQVTGRLRVP